jgi:hypothetical protein
MLDQVPNPYKTTDIIDIYILVLVFQTSDKTKDSELKGIKHYRDSVYL